MEQSTLDVGDTLQEQVRELLDREEIRELEQRYCFLVDTKQPSRIADECYASDGEDLHAPHRTPPYVAKGRDELAEFFAGVLDHFDSTQHFIGNYHCEIQGDEARARVYVLALHWMMHRDASDSGRPADCVLSAAYDDDLVRTESGWRIKRRRLHAFGPGSSLAIGWLPRILQPGIGETLYQTTES